MISWARISASVTSEFLQFKAAIPFAILVVLTRSSIWFDKDILVADPPLVHLVAWGAVGGALVVGGTEGSGGLLVVLVGLVEGMSGCLDVCGLGLSSGSRVVEASDVVVLLVRGGFANEMSMVVWIGSSTEF